MNKIVRVLGVAFVLAAFALISLKHSAGTAEAGPFYFNNGYVQACGCN